MPCPSGQYQHASRDGVDVQFRKVAVFDARWQHRKEANGTKEPAKISSQRTSRNQEKMSHWLNQLLKY
jgi:transposase